MTIKRLVLTVVAAVAVSAGVRPVSAQSAGQVGGIQPEGLAQIAALLEEKASRTPAERKMDSRIIAAERMARGQPIARGIPRLSVALPRAADNRVVVDVRATVTAALMQRIRAAGIGVFSEDAAAGMLTLQASFQQIDTLASYPEVLFIQPMQEAVTRSGVRRPVPGAGVPEPPIQRFDPDRLRAAVRRALAGQAITQAGSAQSEGDVTHRAADARGTYAVDGTGVKIGVLSDGVESLAASQATGDLPPTVTVLPGQTGTGDEGTAMLEIIHDLAPGAELYFATAFNGTASFANNIRALRNTYGCDVIVDDVFYLHETPFQDGQTYTSNTNAAIVIQAVKDVAANGALYFSAAGNSGNLDAGASGTWEGDFVDGGAADTRLLEPGRLHSFGGQTYDVLTASSSYLTLHWAEPLGGATSDYDLFLLNSTGTAVIGAGTNVQSGTQDPYEIVTPSSNTAGLRVVVVLYQGVARFLHVGANRGRFSIATAGEIRGHAATSAPNTFGVAATPAASAFGAGQPVGPYPSAFNSANQVETFSSDGPRRIFFNADGSAITPGNYSSTGGQVLQKPDLTAADGVSVTGAGGFPTPFFGTSASAPHAGAIAALIKSASPSTLTATQVRTALLNSAIDIQAAGVDRDSGVGIVMADTAVQGVLGPVMLLETPADGSTQVQPFTLSGWAIDQSAPSGTGVDTVHVYATPGGGAPIFLGVAAYGAARTDVGNTYGARFTNSGFSLSVTGLDPGTYTLTAYAHSVATGTFNQAMAVTVTITLGSSPIMVLDTPSNPSTVALSFAIAGWAVDLGAPSGPGVDAVHVWAFPSGGGSPVFVGAAAYGGARGDVGTAFGDSRFDTSGFSMTANSLPAGSYQLVVFARSTVTGTFNNARVAEITVTAPVSNPVMVVDTPQQDAVVTRPFVVKGWAIDLASTTGPGVDAVHVWAFPANGDPVLVGGAAYGGARPDVASVFGGSQFTNSGYSLTVASDDLPAGEYNLYVFAHSTISGTFNQVRVIHVIVQ